MEFLFTKIIATLGPASSDPEIILNLIQQGVRIFRINFSHGTFEDYERLLNNIRRAENQSGNHIAVLGDLSGPKIRVGKVIKGGVHLQKGQVIKFVKRDVITGERNFEFVFSSTFPHFIGEVELGERILLDDGNVELKCTGRERKGLDAALICEVINGGLITSAKGINLPDSDLSVPSMTGKDFLCTKFAVEKGFDYLALSFVRSGDDDFGFGLLGRFDYHWNRLIGIPSNWDFYAGASLGFISGDNFDLDLGIQVGGRWYWSDKWGLNLEFGGGTGYGTSIGVSMKL